jgi:hypothetical protein
MEISLVYKVARELLSVPGVLLRRDTSKDAHRARNQLPPGAAQQPITVHELQGRRLLHPRILGGVINEYRYAA